MLQECQTTFVGSDMIRGISGEPPAHLAVSVLIWLVLHASSICKAALITDSLPADPGISAGGQKKRVTLGEQCVGPRNVFMLDEISTGECCAGLAWASATASPPTGTACR